MRLEKLLHGLDVRVQSFALCRMSWGESITLAPDDAATVHYVLKGGFCMRTDGLAPAMVSAGSFIVLPASRRVHLDSSTGNPRPVDAAAACEALGPGHDPATAVRKEDEIAMICGRIDATYRESYDLFRHLDEALIDDFSGEASMERIVDTLLRELTIHEAGWSRLCDMMLQQCLIFLLRRHCLDDECRLPWLTGLEDPRLGRVLDRILDHPEQPHTLEALADIAGMSRSAFALSFARAFGRPAMDFVREIRLRRAARLLHETRMPVKLVAGRVGYRSRSQFSHAFRSLYGVDPAAYRRTAGDGPTADA